MKNLPITSLKLSEQKSTRYTQQATRNLVKKVKEKINRLEHTPHRDLCDFSMEEEGFFRAGKQFVRVIFPR